jgi:hypothetical protein
MKINRWFQGAAVCGGFREYPAGGAFHLYEEAPFGAAPAHCLWTQASYDGATLAQTRRLADVIARHFPSRATCQQCEQSPIMRLIHFNNDPLTTREDIDKVLQIFTEESEAR